MSYAVYKVLHLLGLMLLFFALGGYTLKGKPEAKSERILLAVCHGVGLLLMLVAGFGLLARLGFKGAPGWAWAKVGVWLVFGAAPMVIKRTPERVRPIWAVLSWLGTLAAYLAIAKPFA